MKAIELREKSAVDLRKLLHEEARKQFEIRMQSGMGEAAKPNTIKSLRRNKARILTVINEKERQA